ncbi:MAG TPA: hypothetical protein VN695_01695 [Streptosporangiaceae bacterium]|nr:hypothetical protein [Streptosporangiaceae bacterium]
MFNKLLDPEGAKLPRLAELGPQIGIEVRRLEALTPSQLATEVMTNAFTPEYAPGGGMVGLGAIADYFLPDYGAPRAGDTTSAEEHALCDLLAEGVQLLEQARLVRPKFGYGGGVAGYGWVTTRLGRWALATGNVQTTIEPLAG